MISAFGNKITVFRKIKWTLFLTYISFKGSFKLGIGDEVWWNGRKFVLDDGCTVNNNLEQLWKLRHKKDRTLWKNVNCNELIKVKTIKNYVKSFIGLYQFWKMYWYKSWVDKNKIGDTERAMLV